MDEEVGEFPTTWADLKKYLNAIPEGDSRLAQNIQVLPHQMDQTKPVHLLPVYMWGTVKELLHVDGEMVTETRSAEDFKHHPELLILAADVSPYDEDGDTWFEVQDDGSAVGNHSGKVIPDFWPSREELEAARFTAEGTKPGSDPSTPAEG